MHLKIKKKTGNEGKDKIMRFTIYRHNKMGVSISPELLNTKLLCFTVELGISNIQDSY